MIGFNGDEPNRWQVRLLSIPAFNLLWSFASMEASGSAFPFGLSTWGVLLGASVVILTPVFYHALYRDIEVVGRGDSRWAPDWRLWVGGGTLVSLASLVVFLNPLVHYVAAVYLFQRSRKGSVQEFAGDIEP
ncbi:hypothetical protein [Halorussus salinus]|uniref:hypothetical protein n=1 Tax=Halorussus salinus TaxID=1364935 RepID=UPI0010929B75|nr:hypothetical protein [Halorussus salinus]